MKNRINFKILKNIAIISFFLFASKLSGLFKELVIAFKYGVGYETDSFAFLFTVYSWPIGLFMSVFSVVMIPLFIKIKSQNSDFLSGFLKEVFGGVILLTLTLVLGYVTFFYFIGGNLNNDLNISRLIIELYPYFSLYLLFGMLSAFLSVIMISNNRHINSLLESIVPLGVVLLVLFGSAYFYMTLGLVFGGILQFIALYLIYLYQYGAFIPSIQFKSKYWNELKKGASIVLLGQFLLSFTMLVDQFIAMSFDAGTLSSISYSTRVTGIFMTLIALSFTRAALPIFSDSILNGNIKETRKAVHKWAFILFVFGFGISVFCNYYSDDIVRLIYERGSFINEDTKRVSEFFAISSWLFPFYFSSLVFVSYRNSLKNYYIIMFSGIIGFVSKVVFYTLFSDYLGSEIILYSTVVMYSMTFLFFVLIQFLNE